MATEFQNAINLSGSRIGISYQNKFLGEGFGNYARTKTVSLNGTLDFRSENSDMVGVKEALSSYKEISESAHDSAAITINGYNFGIGRIVSLDFSEEENPIQLGSYSADIEFYETGNLTQELTNINNGTPFDESDSNSPKVYTSLSAIISASGHLIESISENFDFEYGSDSKAAHTHSLNVKYNAPINSHDYGLGSNSPYTILAQNLANSILNAESVFKQADLAFFFPNSGVYDFTTPDFNPKYLYDETIDLVNLQFSFTKKYQHHLQEEFALNTTQPGGHADSSSFPFTRDFYTFNSSRSSTLEEGGFITITENGQVKSRNISSVETVDVGLNNFVLPGAYARCLTTFNNLIGDGTASTDGAVGSYATPKYDPLYSQYITLSTTKNPSQKSIDYSVTFTNNPRYTADGIHEFTITINEDLSAGTLSLSEDGTIRPYGIKDKNFDAVTSVQNIVNNTNGAALTRAINAVSVYMNGNPNTTIINGATIAQTTSSISYPRYGKSISYNCNYTMDGTYLDSSEKAAAGISKIDVSVSDTSPNHIRNNYVVPNHKEIVQDGYQTSIGTRDISVTAQLVRNGNYLTNPPSSAALKTQLDYLANVALGKVYWIPSDYRKAGVREIFISDLTYDFDSREGILSLNLQASFTASAPLSSTNNYEVTKHN